MMRALAGALVVGTLFVLTSPPLDAAAQPPTTQAPTGTSLSAPVGQQRLLQQDEPNRIRLDVTQLTPRMVTSDTSTLSITGKVTNVGDTRISSVSVEVQRGAMLQSDAAVSDALAGAAKTDEAKSGRTPVPGPVPGQLEPGASADFSLNVSLLGDAGGLRIDQPGVYPLVVSVRGTPAKARASQLAVMDLLLPVLSVPGGIPTGPAEAASNVTVLWPLVDDKPRLLLQPSQSNEPLLADDDLATSLSTGGRLFNLLEVIKNAETAASPSPMLQSLCFAIDPDLLATVQAMTKPYLVQGPNGQVTPGKGTAAAGLWLDSLRNVTQGHCVLPLPYADADVVALTRSGAGDLAQLAANSSDSSDIVQQILAPVKPMRGVFWPINGRIDERTLAELTGQSPGATVLASSASLQGATGKAPFTLQSTPENGPGSATHVVPIDQLISSSLDEPADTAATPVSVQNGLAALVYRVDGQHEPGQSILIAPPRRWTAPPSELATFLTTLDRLYTDKFINPQTLGDTLTAAPGGSVSGLDYTPDDAATEINSGVMATLAKADSEERDLLAAWHTDPSWGVSPESLIKPLQDGMLRAASSSWRHDDAGANAAITNVDNQLQTLRDQVTVVHSALPVLRASSDSELPVQIANKLPVAVTVHIAVGESPGLRPNTMPPQYISANSSVTTFIPADLMIPHGRFTVDIGLTTPSGETELGESARFEVSSASYGTITLVFTGVAAAALVLLFGRQIYRRARRVPAGAAVSAAAMESGSSAAVGNGKVGNGPDEQGSSEA